MQQRMRCPSCGTPNPPGQKFCGSCGGPIGNACPNCGTYLDQSDRFCGNCGAQMPGGRAQQQGGGNQQQSYYGQQPNQPQYPTGQVYQQGGWGASPSQQPPPPQQQWSPQAGGGMDYGSYGGAYAPSGRQSSLPLMILLVFLIIALGGFTYWAFLGNTQWSGGGGGNTLQITNGPFIQALSDNTTPTRDVTITLETRGQTSVRIEYGATTTYGKSTEWETTFTSTHNIKLAALPPNTRYHYRVVLKDKQNNEAKSGDFTFKTPE